MGLTLLGKPVVDHMTCDMAIRVRALTQQGIIPALALVRVGSSPDDLSYERTVVRYAEKLGIAIKHFVLDADVSEEIIFGVLQSVNYDDSIHGCLMFRPLPPSVNEIALCSEVAVAKDVDGISLASLAAVFTDADKGFPPSTAAACLEMLDYYHISVAGKHVVILGRSMVVGKPLAMMLLRRNASVSLCHSKTLHLEDITRSADIVVCATGRARAFGAKYFRAGQVVLDVGINFDDEGRLCGDVDFDEVEPLVDAITPVPRGVGAVTTSVTMSHTISAAERAVNASF